MNVTLPVLDRVEASDREEFREAVLAGLARSPRAIPPKFHNDARGSELFDAICELPEYYLTRTETGILADCAPELARRAGPGCALVECGSGSSVKTRLLLDAMPDLAAYVPIDVSRHHLDATAAKLRRDYPRLRVEPVCADYMVLDSLPADVNGAPRLGFFPGSTIGNLEPEDATSFLCRARTLLGDRGAMVLGVDLRKDARCLHDAYNDSAGVTAAFNLNVLERARRELGAEFPDDGFEHLAFYNPAYRRIEMHLRATRPLSLQLDGQRYDFHEGETLHTEHSHKYTVAGFQAMAARAGFEPGAVWTDANGWFALLWLRSPSVP